MKIKLFLLLTFLLSSFAFSNGTWNGGITVDKDKVIAGGSVTATVSAKYDPDDPNIQQEIDEGEADYEYEWKTSGKITSGGGKKILPAQFNFLLLRLLLVRTI